ncbi:hypothetical protein [Clostridium grantii]|uniref:Uncharacterized protein n=1 Tax=Clostridium grantii DSM 8605 TaxID=1121316 RepID=A0A1M5VPD1_9CLOT|nr:hypothetical protein [Clostridium grantii]SHH77141.1 hypothetical protein SAMN02745207_02416 [Clostridium grantii DSM 8605]
MYDAKIKNQMNSLEKKSNKDNLDDSRSKNKYIYDRSFYSAVNSELISSTKSSHIPNENIFQ